MVVEIQNVLNASLAIVSVVTAFFAIVVLAHLSKSRRAELLKRPAIIAFSSLSLAYVLFAVGNIWYYFDQINAGNADLFWVTGSVLMLVGFMAFAWHLYNERSSSRKAGFITLLVTAVVVLAIYMTISNVSSIGNEPNQFQLFLDYFYPISGGLIILFAGFVFFFSEKIPFINTAMYLFATANMVSFLGDFLGLYLPEGTYGIFGASIDGLYLAQYVISFFAFAVLNDALKK